MASGARRFLLLSSVCSIRGASALSTIPVSAISVALFFVVNFKWERSRFTSWYLALRLERFPWFWGGVITLFWSLWWEELLANVIDRNHGVYQLHTAPPPCNSPHSTLTIRVTLFPTEDSALQS